MGRCQGLPARSSISRCETNPRALLSHGISGAGRAGGGGGGGSASHVDSAANDSRQSPWRLHPLCQSQEPVLYRGLDLSEIERVLGRNNPLYGSIQRRQPASRRVSFTSL